MYIYLIRHGEIEANEKRLYCGRTDVSLSEKGFDHIADLKKQGVYPRKVDLFFTSGLLRAEQTVEYIYGSVHAQIISALAEFDFGQFEMKNYEQLKGRPDYQAWITDKTGLVPCPGGESKQRFLARVLRGYHTLIKQSEGADSVLLASHGGVIACVMDDLFPHTRDFYEWQPGPGRGYTLTYTSGKLCGYKKI